MIHRLSLALVMALALAPSLPAQSFNIDIGPNVQFPLPSATFGGDSNQPGVWNAMGSFGIPVPLVDVQGNATGVTIETPLVLESIEFLGNAAGLSPDVIALLCDFQDVTYSETYTVRGLAPGAYSVRTYVRATDNASWSTVVTIDGTAQTSNSSTVHTTLVGTAPLVVQLHGYDPIGPQFDLGSLNGFQIVRISSPGLSSCAGDGLDPAVTTPCPCANNGALGRGCAHSANASGAHLELHGATALNAVWLSATGMPTAASCIFLQGDLNASAGIVFGDGVRCADGNLIRLQAGTAQSGALAFPQPSDGTTLAARGQVTPGSAAQRVYQVYFRNAATFCSPATFNVTNAWRLTW